MAARPNKSSADLGLWLVCAVAVCTGCSSMLRSDEIQLVDSLPIPGPGPTAKPITAKPITAKPITGVACPGCDPKCGSGQGYADCDRDPATGCESHLASDVQNCGRCGNDCRRANANATCQAGQCAFECKPGFADCDGEPHNGCEADLRSASHCGGCGNRCNFSNADASCQAGQCVWACKPDFQDCDGEPHNGCEADLRSTSHCGVCENRCSFANAQATCSAGMCQLERCDEGFADCDGNPSNGCETGVWTDLANCGACGEPCSVSHQTATGAACRAGACVPICTPGLTDCDGDPMNGCEAVLDSDPMHCGTCGNVCPPIAACTDGVCLVRATGVTAAGSHTCVMLESGTVRCWGKNTHGQLGQDPAQTMAASDPGQDLVDRDGARLMGIRKLATGDLHTCGLSQGLLRCWGSNEHGQLGIGLDGASLAKSWQIGPPVLNAGGTPLLNVRHLTLGADHGCALRGGGSTGHCWGAGDHGQLGYGSTLARTMAGTPLETSDETRLVDLQQLALGTSHSCALSKVGVVRCWGGNDWGQLGDGSTSGQLMPEEEVVDPLDPLGGNLTGIAEVSGRGGYTCVLLDSGRVRCWGRNDMGQLGDGTRIDNHLPGPVLVDNGQGELVNVQQLAAGNLFACALLHSGTVRCWGGTSTNGQPSDIPGAPHLRPGPEIPGLGNVTQLAAGTQHVCALLDSGTVRCWGHNDWGQLGYGDTMNRTQPGPELKFPAQ